MSDKNWAATDIIYLHTAELVPYDKNPKDHPDSQIEQISNSIRQWGWTIPILVDEEFSVIAGHGRLYAAQNLGLDEVPCIVAEGWSEEQKRAYVIADNKIAENGGWNKKLLYDELSSLPDTFDIGLTGMMDEFQSMNFAAKILPTFASDFVDGDSLSKAQDKLSNTIEAASTPKDQGGIECLCPYCGEKFTITGH